MLFRSQALLESAELEDGEGKAASQEGYEPDELDAVIASLQASNDGFDAKDAESRIDKILTELKGN